MLNFTLRSSDNGDIVGYLDDADGEEGGAVSPFESTRNDERDGESGGVAPTLILSAVSSPLSLENGGMATYCGCKNCLTRSSLF